MNQSRLPVSLHLKSLLTGTRLEGLAMRLRWLLTLPQRVKHPELWDTFLEEDRLKTILKKELQPDACGVDVGGHLGSFVVLLKAIAPQGRHAVIEASPGKSAWLKRKFPEVEVHGVAVSDKAGTAQFNEDRERPGFSSLVDSSTGADTYEVTTSRLDDLLTSMPRIDIIKLDIEGHELPALRGAAETIKAHRPILIFECGSEYHFNAAGQDRHGIFDFLTQTFGYKVFTFVDFLYCKGELTRDEFRKCGSYPFRAFNFIAMPPETQTAEPPARPAAAP